MRVVRACVVVVLLGTVLIASGVGPSAAAPVTMPVWSASGPGTRVVESSGKTSVPVMSYSLSGPTTFRDKTWSFHAKASSAGTVVLPYDWKGFHSFAGVTTHLAAYVNHGGLLSTIPIVNDGPVNCCTPPSGGFHYTGQVKVHVAAGDIYGFQLGGKNADSEALLQGRLVVGPSTATTARARGSVRRRPGL
jgi:hypothetical protein